MKRTRKHAIPVLLVVFMTLMAVVVAVLLPSQMWAWQQQLVVDKHRSQQELNANVFPGFANDLLRGTDLEGVLDFGDGSWWGLHVGVQGTGKLHPSNEDTRVRRLVGFTEVFPAALTNVPGYVQGATRDGRMTGSVVEHAMFHADKVDCAESNVLELRMVQVRDGWQVVLFVGGKKQVAPPKGG